MEKDATADGMRVEAQGKRKDKEKTKEDTLLASNQGPDEPVYPRPRDASYFFFQPPFSPGVSFLFLPSPLATLPFRRDPIGPFRPLFSSPGRILAGVRDKSCSKVTARMDQIQDPRVVTLGGREGRRRIEESNLSSNDSPGFIWLDTTQRDSIDREKYNTGSLTS